MTTASAVRFLTLTLSGLQVGGGLESGDGNHAPRNRLYLDSDGNDRWRVLLIPFPPARPSPRRFSGPTS